MPRTQSGRVFYYVALTAALAVGALQMFRVRGGLLTDYGADVFGTAWLYAMTRQGSTIVQRGRIASPVVAAAVVLACCVLSEFGQRVGVVPGRFDPYDLAAYGFTTLACCWLDARLGPFAKPIGTAADAQRRAAPNQRRFGLWRQQ